jgi:hypothetical protein
MDFTNIKSAYFGNKPVLQIWYEGHLVWALEDRILDELGFDIMQENSEFILIDEPAEL